MAAPRGILDAADQELAEQGLPNRVPARDRTKSCGCAPRRDDWERLCAPPRGSAVARPTPDELMAFPNGKHGNHAPRGHLVPRATPQLPD
jgi:hypothetical protein